MSENEYCYLNGEEVLLKEAKISVSDIGVMRGYGIYDGLTALGDKVFQFEDHWRRFVDGAHVLGLNIPVTEEKCRKIMEALLLKNGHKRSIIRMILTGGQTIAGIEYDFKAPTFYIVVEKWEPLPEKIYKEGGKLVTYNFKRDWPLIKTTNYIRAVNLQPFRKEEEAIEILYIHEGEALECATSNIFIVKDNKVITPAENILKGITRKAVLELAAEIGLEREERRVGEDELRETDEVFITSSFKDIAPIVKIDDYKINNDKVGAVTANLMSQFAKVLNSG